MMIATNEWLEKIKKAKKTCLIENGTRKVHYRFGPSEEMAEEYNLATGILVRRAWRRGDGLRRSDKWDVEVGDPEPKGIQLDTTGITEASNSPYVVKRITKTSIEWRIRNLPYSLNTYSVTASPNDRTIVVRTSNKKYFKTLTVPELDRVGLRPEQTAISFNHCHSTLIITYKKPKEICDLEQATMKEIEKVKPIQDGNLPCNPS